MQIILDWTEPQCATGRIPYGRVFHAIDGKREIIGCHHQGPYTQRYRWPDELSFVVWETGGDHRAQVREARNLSKDQFAAWVNAARNGKVA